MFLLIPIIFAQNNNQSFLWKNWEHGHKNVSIAVFFFFCEWPVQNNNTSRSQLVAPRFPMCEETQCPAYNACFCILWEFVLIIIFMAWSNGQNTSAERMPRDKSNIAVLYASYMNKYKCAQNVGPFSLFENWVCTSVSQKGLVRKLWIIGETSFTSVYATNSIWLKSIYRIDTTWPSDAFKSP